MTSTGPRKHGIGRRIRISLGAALIAIVLGAAAPPAPAAGTWRVYLYGNEVRDLAARGEEVWAATTGGLVRLRADGAMSQWNRASHGLLSDSVATVAVDAAGHIWAGTETVGISVFEPERVLWTDYNDLSHPIPGNQILRVRFAGDASAETLFVGGSKGYSVLINGELRQGCLEGADVCGLPSYQVRDLLGVAGELWLATAGNDSTVGVVVQHPDGTWSPRDEGLGLGHPRRLARADSLYLVTDPTSQGALWVRRGGRWGSVSDPSLPSWFIPVELLAVDDTLYAAGFGGVYRRAQGVWSPAGDLSSFTPARTDTVTVTGLARTSSGRLYAGASDPQERRDGIWERRGGSWVQHHLAGPSLLSDYRSMAFDPEGALWISSVRRRVSPLITRYHDGAWTLFRGNEGGRSNAWTYEMLSLTSGIWLAHCCGPREEADRYLMERIEGGEQFTTWPVLNAIDLDSDDQGRIWIATNGLEYTDASGLYRLDPRQYPPDASSLLQVAVNTPGAELKSDRLNAVAVVGNQIWIGYPDAGVSRWDLGADRLPLTSDDSWAQLTETRPGFPLIGNNVTRIVPGPDGRIWIGTTAGLSIFEDPKFINIAADGRLPTSEVSDILPLDDGGAFVATRGGGLTRLTPRSLGGYTYTVYGPPDLPNPTIEAMAVAPDGRTLWLATGRGLASFIPPESTPSAQVSEVGAYPNPFNPACADGVRLLGAGSSVRGTVLDLSGKVVAEFPSDGGGTQDAALTVWDGKHDGRAVAPGLYWIRVQTAQGVRSVGVAVLDGDCAR